MPPIVVRYNLDPTGLDPNNLVQNEPHLLVRRVVRSIAPLYGAYFADSMVITDVVTNRKLIRNQHWYPAEMYEVPTAKYGKDVYAIIIITDTTVGDNVTIQYQAIGGEYSTAELAIVQQLNNLSLDNRPATWPAIINKPDGFPPSMHLHDIGDVYGFEYLVHALERVKTAIEFGDQVSHDQILKYFDLRLSGSNDVAATAIANETSARTTADDLNAATIASEVINRTNALVIESTARTSGDNILTAALANETTERTNADANNLATAKAYAESLVVGLWDDRGNYDASVNTFPAAGGSGVAGAILKGDIWNVSVAGTLATIPVALRQTVRALIDNPGQTAANWAIGLANADIEDVITAGVIGKAPSQNDVSLAIAAINTSISTNVTILNTAIATKALLNGSTANLFSVKDATAPGHATALAQVQSMIASATYGNSTFRSMGMVINDQTTGSYSCWASGTGDSNIAGITFHNPGNYGIKLGLRADGYFGLGGWSRAAWSWYSDPNGNCVTSGNFTGYSDPRLKDNVRIITNPFAILNAIDGVRFNWNRVSELVQNKWDKEDIGLLSDQVKSVLPEVITPSMRDDTNDTTYDTVDYSKLVPVLIEAVKEVKADTIRLRAEIVRLQAEIVELKKGI